MSKKLDYTSAIRESMNQLDEFWKRSEPKDVDADSAANRRLHDVTRRADDEARGYGFLRSLKKKVFGQKAPEEKPEFKRPERSEDERRAAVIARAKKDS
jgi:hypothetical protein